MYLVDADALIWILRGYAPARDWLVRARRAGPVFTSTVTVAQVLGGMRSPERHETRRLLAVLRKVPVDERVAIEAGSLQRRFRASHRGIDLGDYLLAGTCVVAGLELATLNVKHFPMFPELAPPFAPPPG
jgi:predicted nucleic acid-binding protein